MSENDLLGEFLRLLLNGTLLIFAGEIRDFFERLGLWVRGLVQVCAYRHRENVDGHLCWREVTGVDGEIGVYVLKALNSSYMVEDHDLKGGERLAHPPFQG